MPVLTGIWNGSQFPPPWLRPHFQLKKNSPKAWCCHHHASMRVWCSFGDLQCWFCAKHTFYIYGQKVQPWFHQTITHFATCFWETYNVFLLMFYVGLDVFLATLPHSPDIWRIWEIVVTCTKQPVLARNSCSSFNIAVGLLASSLTSFLLIFSSILEGHPVLGNINVAPYCLHLMMIVLTVFHVYLMPWKFFCTRLLTDTF